MEQVGPVSDEVLMEYVAKSKLPITFTYQGKVIKLIKSEEGRALALEQLKARAHERRWGAA